MKIKHVSFDVWGTLISANPEFAAARTDFLSREFNVGLANVKAAYTKVKQLVDTTAETQGIAYSTDQVFNLLYNELKVDLLDIHHKFVRATVEQLFIEHPPLILNKTRHLIDYLAEKRLTLSIGSNSNFISGDVMFPFLQTEFNEAFSFGVFSDKIDYAKPNAVFFSTVMHELHKLYNFNWTQTPTSDRVLHVGDNYVCDGSGPKQLDMAYTIVDGPEDLQSAFRHLAYLFK